MTNVPALFEIKKIAEDHINKVKVDTGEVTVVDYRNWKSTQKKQSVYQIPIEYCLFRIDNGRIMMEVMSYQTTKGSLADRDDPRVQEIISNFLGNSDKEKNLELKQNLKKDSQIEPAIITADGLLINGNRRKWALESLYKSEPSEAYKYLKVVILPGTDSPERPTVKDIALLENRLQFQKMGKSEYTPMNKALKLLQNEQQGIPLEEMLRDDPTYSGKTDKEFKKAIKVFRDENLGPIKLMSEYLNINKIKGDFNRLEHKFSAFQDLNTRIISKLDNPRILAEHKIQDHDIGLIKTSAYNIIKMRDHSSIEGRTHMLMRDIFKWMDADKKEFLKIGRIDDLTDIQDPDERFEKWNDKYNDKILDTLKKLKGLAGRKKDQEDPITRLIEAIQKLKHEDLEFEQVLQMKKTDIKEALKLANKAQTQAKYLTDMFYYLDKDDKFKLETLVKEYKKRRN